MVVVVKGARSPFDRSKVALAVPAGPSAANDNPSAPATGRPPATIFMPPVIPEALDVHQTLVAWASPAGLGSSLWRLACGIAVMQTACLMTIAFAMPFGVTQRKGRPHDRPRLESDPA